MPNMSERDIRQVLAELYYIPEQARLVAEDIGLQLAKIAYSPIMEVYWHNIWRETKLQYKELDLIERVQKDYPRDERIIQIRIQIIFQQRHSQPDTQMIPQQNPSDKLEQPGKPKAFDGQLTLFYSYAHEDEALRKELEKHLSLLRNQGLIAQWYDRDISAGTEWANQIDDHLHAADIILLLISPDFMTSKYCYGIEMKCALQRHELGDARIIPILLRPVDWQDAPFSKLQVLPQNAQPVTTWANRDSAFEEIAKQIRKVVDQLKGRGLS